MLGTVADTLNVIHYSLRRLDTATACRHILRYAFYFVVSAICY
jgi:hypothetical protein